MKLYADTSNLDELKELKSWGIISGCTTNPLILAKAGVTDMPGHMVKVLQLMQCSTSIEVTTNTLPEMLEEARDIASWNGKDKNIAVKLPMTIDGLKATFILSQEGVRINVTACMNTVQAVLAAKAGAAYSSIFWGRVEDLGYDAAQVVSDTKEILEKSMLRTEIIVGSLRSVGDVTKAMKTGAQVLTVPPEILKKLPVHPRTESTISEFLVAYNKVRPAKMKVSQSRM